jgi:hypothetical protein
LAALQNRLDILINFRFNVMVLPDVTVEFNFHGAGNYLIAAQKQAFLSEENNSLGMPAAIKIAACPKRQSQFAS